MKRCEWASTGEMQEYHDGEWGIPVHDDKKLFEFLVLEGAQAGLSWAIILNRRENYRKAFDNFDFEKIAKYTDKEIENLLKNKGIIRNKLKIKSVVNNAKKFMKIREEFGSFDSYLWGFTKGKQIRNAFETLSDVPAKTDLSEKISKDLKQRGFTFLGPVICYAFLQAVGIVNDHTMNCFRNQNS